MTHTARAERLVAAPPSRVWQALTDPAELAAWYWPARFATEVVIEPWAAGRFVVASPPMGMAARGQVTDAEAPTRLDLTWQWDGEAEVTTVTVTLEAAPGGTRIHVEHAGFSTAQAATDHAQGWSDCLGRLPRHLGLPEA